MVEQVVADLRQNVVSYASSDMAVGNTNSESYNAESETHTLKTDDASRQYYQLLTGPYRLSTTIDDDARYLVNVILLCVVTYLIAVVTSAVICFLPAFSYQKEEYALKNNFSSPLLLST